MTSTPRRTLASAVRRPAPAALIEGAPDRSPTSLAAAPALAPETFDPVRAIATLDDMRAAIAATTDPHELRDVVATTSALQGWLAHQRRSTALANAASATTLTAERRLGGVLAAMERARGRRNGGPSEYQAALTDNRGPREGGKGRYVVRDALAAGVLVLRRWRGLSIH